MGAPTIALIILDSLLSAVPIGDPRRRSKTFTTGMSIIAKSFAGRVDVLGAIAGTLLKNTSIQTLMRPRENLGRGDGFTYRWVGINTISVIHVTNTRR